MNDLRSFKLRPVAGHVRVVLAGDGNQARPGVDLLGAAAARAFELAAPLLEGCRDHAPTLGAGLRAVSVQLVQARVLCSFDPPQGLDGRAHAEHGGLPRVSALRLPPETARALLARSHALLAYLASEARATRARREP